MGLSIGETWFVIQWNRASAMKQAGMENYMMRLFDMALSEKALRSELRQAKLRNRHYDTEEQRRIAVRRALTVLPEIITTTSFNDIMSLKDEAGELLLFETPSRAWDP